MSCSDSFGCLVAAIGFGLTFALLLVTLFGVALGVLGALMIEQKRKAAEAAATVVPERGNVRGPIGGRSTPH